MTQEEKLEEAQRLYKTANQDQRYVLEKLFPELKESEDEKVREVLVGFFKRYKEQGTCGAETFNGIPTENILAWLEKQGEQKTTDEVKSKFKVGDWISGYYTNYKVLSVNNEGYVVEDVDGNKINILLENEKFHHLWTIRDAKDGDVLYHKAENGIEYIVMNKGLNEFNNIDSYFRYNSIDGFNTDIPSVLSAKCDSITPATKEQRDLLFQKMHEAGWEFDFDKKELKKISQRMISAEAKEAMYDKPTDLEVFINELSKQFPDVSFAKLSRIAVRVAKWANKPCWSEDDKKHIIDIIDYLDDYYSFAKDEYEDVADGVQNEIRWLQRIKERL